MTPDPSPSLQAKRWESAKALAVAFKSYCEKHKMGFILEEDSDVFEPYQIDISEDEINIKTETSRATCYYNLYTNDIELDHGVHDTTSEWYTSCSLFKAKLVKLESTTSFRKTFFLSGDEYIPLNVDQ